MTLAFRISKVSVGCGRPHRMQPSLFGGRIRSNRLCMTYGPHRQIEHASSSRMLTCSNTGVRNHCFPVIRSRLLSSSNDDEYQKRSKAVWGDRGRAPLAEDYEDEVYYDDVMTKTSYDQQNNDNENDEEYNDDSSSLTRKDEMDLIKNTFHVHDLDGWWEPQLQQSRTISIRSGSDIQKRYSSTYANDDNQKNNEKTATTKPNGNDDTQINTTIATELYESTQTTIQEMIAERDERNIAEIMAQSANGYGSSNETEHLTTQAENLQDEIRTLADNPSLNIGSTKQLRELFYDTADTNLKTDKNALEAIAGGSLSDPSRGKKKQLAQWIVEYRRCKSQLKRMERQRQAQEDQIRSQHSSNPSPAPSQTASEHVNEVVLQDQPRDPLLILDASAYIFRAYHAMPPIHRYSDGMPTGAVLGFCQMILKLVLERLNNGERPRMVLAFDLEGGSTKRKKLFPEYKANRPPKPLDLIPQFELVKRAATEAFGIPCIEAQGYEADDVIATLSTKALEENVNVNILSGDKDLMQLVTPMDNVPSIHLVDPFKLQRATHDVVLSKWGVPPNQLGDLLALAGDSSDNIPGVPGIGPKIAAKLIQEYETLENLLDNAENIAQTKRRENLIDYAEVARLSRELVELERHVPDDKMIITTSTTQRKPTSVLGEFDDEQQGNHTVTNRSPLSNRTLDSLRMKPLNGNAMLQFFEYMEFSELKRKTSFRIRDNVPQNLKSTTPDDDNPSTFSSKAPQSSFDSSNGDQLLQEQRKLSGEEQIYSDLEFPFSSDLMRERPLSSSPTTTITASMDGINAQGPSLSSSPAETVEESFILSQEALQQNSTESKIEVEKVTNGWIARRNKGVSPPQPEDFVDVPF